MLLATTVTTADELQQIYDLSFQNLRTNISQEEIAKEGFTSWQYSLELLQQLHSQQPSVIVKDDDKVIAYALVALMESRVFHKDLETLMHGLSKLSYNDKLLNEYNFYAMGQICIHKDYRGIGVFPMLYDHHKELFQNRFDFVVTDISINNPRSIRAHEKVGFKTIYTYTDAVDEWNVVVWDWK